MVQRTAASQRPGLPSSGTGGLSGQGAGWEFIPAGACGSRPALIDDVGRIGRVVAEPVAQPLDVGAHPLGVAGVPSGPNLAQQGLVRQDPARGLREHAQQLVLGRRQRHRAPATLTRRRS